MQILSVGIVAGRFEQLHRLHGHNGRDCMLVDKLRLTFALQQNAEIVEPSHNALKLNAIHEKDGQRGFGPSDSVQEGILEILFFIP
jgi:hypothetical protein